MDFELSEDQEALVDGVRAVLEGRFGIADVRSMIETGLDRDRWAELGATGGPVYDLSELGDVNEIGQLLDVLDSMNVRWGMDRAGQLVVHYNDEARVDEMMDRVFGSEDDDWDDDEPAATGAGPISLPVEVDSALGTSTVNATFDASMPEPPDEQIEGSSGINDLHGRPTVDDMMSPPIQTSGTPWWLAAVAAVVLVVLFIMFVV